MEEVIFKLDEVSKFIEKANYLINQGAKEDVVRSNFTAHLSRMFPDPPAWVHHHIVGGESFVRFARNGVMGVGFIDNLVGLTPIEYESDLRSQEKFRTGYNQVKSYCAALLNQNQPSDLIIGVLSDTIRWRAYRISEISQTVKVGMLGAEEIELELIEEFEAYCTEESALKLIDFLQTYLGRIGARPLNARSIADDFGFESPFSVDYIKSFDEIVNIAFESNEKYAQVISGLWNRFVTYLRDQNSLAEFDIKVYSDELYMLTLAKLICANLLERKGIISTVEEIRAILNGKYFERKGFTNLVEYDYFGWVNNDPYLESIVPVAQKMQEDLRAYDFNNTFPEDLFGRMFAQLSNRSHRILLGQEWTPHWLAHQMAQKVFDELPDDELPRLVDMCCGSGVMIVETLRMAKDRIITHSPQLDERDRLNVLVESITGFDIDPLAVILSKISWIITAQDWLQGKGIKITIPIYHADSLFAITPLNEIIEEEDIFELDLANSKVKLPQFLLAPEYQSLFDSIIDKGYKIALQNRDLDNDYISCLCSQIITTSMSSLHLCLPSEQVIHVAEFLASFIEKVNKLHREGKNGVWAFILKNSYRPGLVAGKFNGLISNPPWLALSKIANNPYKDVLSKKAKDFAIKPSGSSFLHIEIATVFLLHGIDRYLKEGAIVACIVPDSVLNGQHHNPFRLKEYTRIPKPIHFNVNEIWKIERLTFKNEAVVLIGKKENVSNNISLQGFGTICGKVIHRNREHNKEIVFYKNILGERTAWDTRRAVSQMNVYNPADFQQGADIMPRVFHFFNMEQVSNGLYRVRSIDSTQANLAFLTANLKNFKDFTIQECYVQEDVVYDVFISTLLTPFEIAEPLKAVLPIKRNDQNLYTLIPYDEVLIRDDDLEYIIRTSESSAPGYASFWSRLNIRNKLVRQSSLPTQGYFVYVGTSGAKVCAAYKAADEFNMRKVVIDQTLNWAHVNSEEEALYLTGLFNSESINQVISVFQPRGQQGERHIHSLPFHVTPPFNVDQRTHQMIVEITQQLLAEYSRIKVHDSNLVSNLDPAFSSLPHRRTFIRNKIKELPSYRAYEEACRKLYDV